MKRFQLSGSNAPFGRFGRFVAASLTFCILSYSKKGYICPDDGTVKNRKIFQISRNGKFRHLGMYAVLLLH
jgi:hypothetical protein